MVVFSVVMSEGEATTLSDKQNAAADLVAMEEEIANVRRQNRCRF